MPDGSNTPPASQPMPVSEMIAKYIALRDKKDAIKKLHAEQLQPYTNAMEQLEGLVLGVLNTAGVESLKAADGTAYKSTETSVSVKDWPETLQFIKDNDLWDLLEARVSKTAAVAVVEEKGAPIPGVNITQTSVLRIRRS